MVYGHSFGGSTAAVAAQRDDRVIGGVNLDGPIYGPVDEQGFQDKPFVLVASMRNFTRPNPPPVSEWTEFYSNVDAAKMELIVWDTQHYAFTDVPLLLTVYHQTPPASQLVVDQTFGTLSGRRVEAATNGIVAGLMRLVYDGDAEPLRDVGGNADVDVVRSDLPECE